MSLSERFNRAIQQGTTERAEKKCKEEETKNARYRRVFEEVSEVNELLREFEQDNVFPILKAVKDSVGSEDAEITSALYCTDPRAPNQLRSASSVVELSEDFSPSGVWWGWDKLEGSKRNLKRVAKVKWNKESWDTWGGPDGDFQRWHGTYDAVIIEIFEQGQSFLNLPIDAYRLPDLDDENWEEETVAAVEKVLRSGTTHFEY